MADAEYSLVSAYNIEDDSSQANIQARTPRRVTFGPLLTPPETPAKPETGKATYESPIVAPVLASPHIPVEAMIEDDHEVSRIIDGLPFDLWADLLDFRWHEVEKMYDTFITMPSDYRDMVPKHGEKCTTLLLDMLDIEHILKIAKSKSISVDGKLGIIHREIARHSVARQIKLKFIKQLDEDAGCIEEDNESPNLSACIVISVALRIFIGFWYRKLCRRLFSTSTIASVVRILFRVRRFAR